MIKLRDYRADDYEAVARNANNPAVVAFLRTVFPSPYTENDAKWWVSEGSKLPGIYNQVIEFADQYAGNIGATFREDKTTAEIGIWLGQSFWGKGLASEAVSTFSASIFNNFNTQTLVAHIAVGHNASIKLFEKCGYKFMRLSTESVGVHSGSYSYLIYAKHS